MRYEYGYTCGWRLVGVDPTSWADAGGLGHVSEAGVTRSVDGDAPTVDSADATLSAPAPAVGTYARLWMDARARGELARVPVVTGRVEPSTSEVSGGLRVSSAVTLASVLAPAEDADVDEGWYAPAGADGAAMAAALLRSVLDAPVDIAEGERPTLSENVVAGSDSVLSVAWALLGDTWELVTDGLGRVTLRPRPTSPATVTDAMLCSKLKEGADDDGTPTLDYTREWSDEIGIGARVRVAGMAGDWRVVSQRITCGRGATVDETVRRI